MNYLEHAYLSFYNEEVLFVNMIADFVKGKKQYNYPSTIHKGIVLHRLVDEFTDNHQYTREAKKIFQQTYRLYSDAFIDIVYDHFLAMNPNQFLGEELFSFSQQTYVALQKNRKLMPKQFAHMFLHMEKQNWLYTYRTVKAINNGFRSLVSRARYLTDGNPAELFFINNYYVLQKLFYKFWAELKPFVLNKLTTFLTMS